MIGVRHVDNGRRLGRRASFVLLVCANVLMMATASAPSPIYPLYRERWGFSVTMLTVIFAGYVARSARRLADGRVAQRETG